MNDDNSTLAISLFSEILTVDQLLNLEDKKLEKKGSDKCNGGAANWPNHGGPLGREQGRSGEKEGSTRT